MTRTEARLSARQIPYIRPKWLDVRGVHDVDDGRGLLIQDEAAGDDLLAAVGGHGVDAGEVRDQRLGVTLDDPVLPVHGDAGEVAHVLVGAGELVEEGLI